MKYFITGASGWIGSATTRELVAAGHQVTGLARSDAAAAAITEAGGTPLRGTLDDADVLRSAAQESDGVIHLGFDHAAMAAGDFGAAVGQDRRVVELFGDSLAGTGKPLAIASGVGGLMAPGQVATERDGHGPVDPANPADGRRATAELTLGLAERGVRSIVVRLAPSNHGEGDHGFLAELVKIAKDKQLAGYLGDGRNVWPAVHRLDTAKLIASAVEKAPAGSTLHAVAEQGVALGDIAAVIGRHLDVPVRSIAADDAQAHFGWFAWPAGFDAPASSDLTRQRLGWNPEQPGLLEDLEAGHYFG